MPGKRFHTRNYTGVNSFSRRIQLAAAEYMNGFIVESILLRWNWITFVAGEKIVGGSCINGIGNWLEALQITSKVDPPIIQHGLIGNLINGKSVVPRRSFVLGKISFNYFGRILIFTALKLELRIIVSPLNQPIDQSIEPHSI